VGDHVLRQRELVGQLADALLGREHRAQSSVEGTLDQVRDHALQAPAHRLLVARLLRAGVILGGHASKVSAIVEPMQPAKELPLAVETSYSTLPLALEPARPPARGRRMLKAYWVTFVVIASYLGAKIWARLRSPQAMERILLEKHQRNARRIEKAILELQ